MKSLFLFIILIVSSCSGSEHKETINKTENISAAKKQKETVTNIPKDKISLERYKNYTVRVLKTLDHDPEAFTQGLVFHDGFLYESAGQRGESSLRKLDPATGNVLNKVDLSSVYFAEGLDVFNNKIYQLTWTSGLCFVYDLAGMNLEVSMKYYNQGWGLTNDGELLIMSDGSDVIHFKTAADFETVRTISVRENGKPVKNLNELEYINDEIWANVWLTNSIVRISPTSGEVLGRIELMGLWNLLDKSGSPDVPNGIAYNPNTDEYYVTGKLWDKMFIVDFVAE